MLPAIHELTDARHGGKDVKQVYRSDVGWAAGRRVRSNKGAAGVEEDTLRSIEERDVAQFLDGIIAKLNPVLRGWGNYIRTRNADRKFNSLDSYVCERLLLKGVC
jgi:hypothetical protein